MKSQLGWPMALAVGDTNRLGFASPAAEATGHPRNEEFQAPARKSSLCNARAVYEEE